MLRALVDPGKDGGRNHVAAEGDHRQAAFGLRPRARSSATTVAIFAAPPAPRVPAIWSQSFT